MLVSYITKNMYWKLETWKVSFWRFAYCGINYLIVSSRGRGSGGSGRTDSGGSGGFSQFSYKRGTGGTSRGRGSSTSTKRPGFLNISSGSRSFLGSAAYTFK